MMPQVSAGDVSSGDLTIVDVLPHLFLAENYDDLIELYSQTVTSGQSINSTALNFFKGILDNQLLPVDYVIYVGSTYTYNYNSVGYEYCLAYGNLELSGTHFTGNGTIVTMRTQGTQSVTYQYDQTIDLNAPIYYSRSNLGDYSGIVQYNYTGFLILLCLVTGGLTWFLKKLMRLNY